MWPAHNWFWAAQFGALLGGRNSRLSFCTSAHTKLCSRSPRPQPLKQMRALLKCSYAARIADPFIRRVAIDDAGSVISADFLLLTFWSLLLISEWANWSNSFSYANAAAVPQRHLTAGDYETCFSTVFQQISTCSLKNVIDKCHYSTTKTSIDVWWWFTNGST